MLSRIHDAASVSRSSPTEEHRLEDVLGAFHAGESLEFVAQEYGVPADELEDALRVASRPIA
ncbi:MAG TPA: hypothetical protein VG165_15300 [Solirubrobacteraceae bacterium]|jgi:hypothetical protein|nr:hypothetical protein [Solirubrobacteraceae bacterium]